MDNYIMLASMTEAMRAKNILSKYRIFSKVQRMNNRNYSNRGCMFGIYIPQNKTKALEILENYRIFPVGRAYGDRE